MPEYTTDVVLVMLYRLNRRLDADEKTLQKTSGMLSAEMALGGAARPLRIEQLDQEIDALNLEIRNLRRWIRQWEELLAKVAGPLPDENALEPKVPVTQVRP
jgi:hypothetical protein